ncbi:MAG: deoxyguanosinetriphosphate triphosphohydrolase [Candidatus Aminicenantes bacterium]|nr:deoxyguanosinetriphosphate triphosphohydrolase [Candidatus Aminicenantes bacterium]
MNIRVELEKREDSLHPKAAKSANSSRQREEKKSPVRTEFQRDRDRIIHAKSFRRLEYKTQVFIAPQGDHFRTRLTHTLEVSQIARTIAKALNLNEDLTEAIALGHDLGHTPFGHTGEKVIDELLDEGFRHYKQSLRVVDKLEYDGKGLNLTTEVRDGIVKHSKGLGPIIPEDNKYLPLTLEGHVVRISDIIAYVNHDIDDAIRAKLIMDKDIPASTKKLLGRTFAKRIDTIVLDVIDRSLHRDLETITMSDEIYEEITKLRGFLYDRVYWVKESARERKKIETILLTIFSHIKKEPAAFINPFPENDPVERRIIDFIAGMTDRYSLNLFKHITLPIYYPQHNGMKRHKI